MTRTRYTSTTTRHSSKGFTLLELIVVIVILGILAAIAIPTFQKSIQRSGEERTKTTAVALDTEARSLAKFDGDPVSVDDYVEAAADTKAAQAPGTTAATATVEVVVVTDSDALGSGAAEGQVAVYITSTTATIAMRAPSGRPVYVTGPVDAPSGVASVGSTSSALADPRDVAGTPSVPTTTTTTTTAPAPLEDWQPVVDAAAASIAAGTNGRSADYDGLKAANVATLANALNVANVERVIIYNATSADGTPPSTCKTGTCTTGSAITGASYRAFLTANPPMTSATDVVGCINSAASKSFCPVNRAAGDTIGVAFMVRSNGQTVTVFATGTYDSASNYTGTGTLLANTSFGAENTFRAVNSNSGTQKTYIRIGADRAAPLEVRLHDARFNTAGVSYTGTAPCQAPYTYTYASGSTGFSIVTTAQTLTGPLQYQTRPTSSSQTWSATTTLAPGATYTAAAQRARQRAPQTTTEGQDCPATLTQAGIDTAGSAANGDYTFTLTSPSGAQVCTQTFTGTTAFDSYTYLGSHRWNTLCSIAPTAEAGRYTLTAQHTGTPTGSAGMNNWGVVVPHGNDANICNTTTEATCSRVTAA